MDNLLVQSEFKFSKHGEYQLKEYAGESGTFEVNGVAQDPAKSYESQGWEEGALRFFRPFSTINVEPHFQFTGIYDRMRST